jgi:hypothetical protein
MGVGGHSTARPLYPRERATVPILQEARWAPAPVWTGAENLAPNVQPVLSRLTEIPRPPFPDTLMTFGLSLNELTMDKLLSPLAMETGTVNNILNETHIDPQAYVLRCRFVLNLLSSKYFMGYSYIQTSEFHWHHVTSSMLL